MPIMPTTHRPKGHVTRRDQNRAYDRRRDQSLETRRLYKLARWLKIRAAQLLAEPTCRMCWELDQRATPATVCDHVEAHGGDVEKFWAGPFQSLCARCHNSRKQAEEAAARRGSAGG
jgi:5-methylcytosine-specific restriction protein A